MCFLFGHSRFDLIIIVSYHRRPFGALMTLQYGLTAGKCLKDVLEFLESISSLHIFFVLAPASQPRNAIVGQTLALCIARGIGEASNVELWVRQTIATSLAIA